MPKFRNVFFSFHYSDATLASIVRNCHEFMPNGLTFRDWVDWEEVRLKSSGAIESWIDAQLQGTSVTIVLIGSETASRHWVHHEIRRSVERGNGLFGIYLNKMRGPRQVGTSPRGANPFWFHPRRYIPSPTSRSQTAFPAGIIDGVRGRTEARNVLAGLLAAAPRPQNALAGLLGAKLAAPSFGLLDSWASEPHTPQTPASWLPNIHAAIRATGPRMQPPGGSLADEVPCYCWVSNNGYSNIGSWIEKAATQVGR